jgi:hypothetical protein
MLFCYKFDRNKRYKLQKYNILVLNFYGFMYQTPRDLAHIDPFAADLAGALFDFA